MLTRKKFLKILPLFGGIPGCFLKKTTHYYMPRINIFYRPEMALARDSGKNFSKSPLKPRLFMEYIRTHGFMPYFNVTDNWQPMVKSDFLIAHTRRYVSDFFLGRKPLSTSNQLSWSSQFTQSIRYTNGSLYAALEGAIKRPEQIMLSPTSGFHHARPDGGDDFCTMSGQVISSVKIFRKYGLRGAYIDLDAHFGNSIEDSRDFVKDLDQAIPPGCNINPRGMHGEFLYDLANKLNTLREFVREGRVHYLVVAHGADSHEWDDLGGLLSFGEWTNASRMVYGTVQRLTSLMNRPIPLVLCFFGGYRKDHFNSVLALHTLDLLICLGILSNNKPVYSLKVDPVLKQIRLSAGRKAFG